MSAVHLRVRVADEEYALPVENVVEVAEVGGLTPVPGAPAEILGVRNLRGNIVPVIDLGTLLGLAGGETERIVIAEHADRRAGLAVGDVLDVVELPAPSEETRSELLLGAALVDGALIGVIDVGAVLAAPEQG